MLRRISINLDLLEYVFGNSGRRTQPFLHTRTGYILRIRSSPSDLLVLSAPKPIQTIFRSCRWMRARNARGCVPFLPPFATGRYAPTFCALSRAMMAAMRSRSWFSGIRTSGTSSCVPSVPISVVQSMSGWRRIRSRSGYMNDLRGGPFANSVKLRRICSLT